MTEPNSPAHNKRPYRSREQWRQLINDFEASNLSVDNYCAQHNLKHTTFYKWRNELQRAHSTPHTPSAFIELTDLARTSPTNESTWDIELELGSGTFLRIRRP